MSGRTLGELRDTASSHCDELITRHNSKKVRNNTLEYWTKDGTHYILLHATTILTFRPNKDVIVDTKYWMTHTTRTRLREFLPDGIHVFSMRGQWYLSTGAWDSKAFTMIEFDGYMELPGGKLPPPPDGYVWGLKGKAVLPDEYHRQIIQRKVTDLRRHLNRYQWWQDKVNWTLIRDALTWKGNTPEAVEYVIESVEIARSDINWDGTPITRYTVFPPARNVITRAVKHYLEATHKEDDYE